MMQLLRRRLFFIDNLYITLSLIIFFVYLLSSLYIYSLVYINGIYGRAEKT